MNRLVALTLGLALVSTSIVAVTAVAEEKTIARQRTKDVAVALKSETGSWKPGKNTFVVELTTAKDGKPIDAGKVTLDTSMTMAGMAPMQAAATVTPDKAPGRYLGAIEFQDSGTRQVTVSWDGPAGKGSTKFPVAVK
jgi:YtkA-like protein